MTYKTFKQLVYMVVDTSYLSDEYWNNTAHQIKMSFEHDKITWGDYELLHRMLDHTYGSWKGASL